MQTHILSGWCLGNLVPRFSPRERLFCMLAATLADLDGLSIVGGQEAYWDYHHVLGHNLLYGACLSLVLAAFSPHRVAALGAYLALFHLHLAMDYYGSGPGWGIFYLWPFSRREWRNPDAWPFYSWQNISAFAGLLASTLWIARHHARTPLEAVMPELDWKLVRRMRPAESRPGREPRRSPRS